jgi:hypothetical protein
MKNIFGDKYNVDIESYFMSILLYSIKGKLENNNNNKLTGISSIFFPYLLGKFVGKKYWERYGEEAIDILIEKIKNSEKSIEMEKEILDRIKKLDYKYSGLSDIALSIFNNIHNDPTYIMEIVKSKYFSKLNKDMINEIKNVLSFPISVLGDILGEDIFNEVLNEASKKYNIVNEIYKSLDQ